VPARCLSLKFTLFQFLFCDFPGSFIAARSDVSHVSLPPG
jgi:hypothetical protein